MTEQQAATGRPDSYLKDIDLIEEEKRRSALEVARQEQSDTQAEVGGTAGAEQRPVSYMKDIEVVEETETPDSPSDGNQQGRSSAQAPSQSNRSTLSNTATGSTNPPSSVILSLGSNAGSAIRRERRTTGGGSSSPTQSGIYAPTSGGGRTLPPTRTTAGSGTPPARAGSNEPGAAPGATSPRPEGRDEGEDMRELSLKVLLIGPRLVGKTTIVHLITKGKFEPNLSTTVGVDFGTHSWVYGKHPCGDNVRMKAEFFDIMGQDRTPIIQRYIAKGTKAVLAVTSYPVTTESLAEISQWIGAFQKAHPDYPVPVYLLVNKCDTMSQEQIKAYDRMLRKFVQGEAWLGGDEMESGKRFDVEMLKGYSPTSARDKTNLPSAVKNFIESVANTVPEEYLQAPAPVEEPKYTAQRQQKKKKSGCACKN